MPVNWGHLSRLIAIGVSASQHYTKTGLSRTKRSVCKFKIEIDRQKWAETWGPRHETAWPWMIDVAVFMLVRFPLLAAQARARRRADTDSWWTVPFLFF